MNKLSVIIGFMVVLSQGTCFSNEKTYTYLHLNTNHGISHPRISALAKDQAGFLWVGTYMGLNRFDGQQFISFNHDPDDPGSLSHDDVRVLHVDKHNNLWVGTSVGTVDLFEASSGTFRRIAFDRPISSGRLWSIKAITHDQKGYIWATTTLGLLRIDANSYETNFYSLPDSLLDKGMILEMSYFFSDNAAIVSFWKGGIMTFDFITGKFEPFDLGIYSNKLDGVTIMSMARDSHGTFWMGTYEKGLVRMTLQENAISDITFFSHDPNNRNSLNQNKVKKVFVTPEDKLWIGTEEGGLVFFDPEIESFQLFLSPFHSGYNPEGESVYDILCDGNNMLWAGTRDSGLFYLNTRKKFFTHIRQLSGDPYPNREMTISALYEDHQGKVWAGFAGDIALIDLEQKVLIPQKLNLPQLPNTIAEDSLGNLWIGGLNGLITRYHPDEKTLKMYAFPELDQQKIRLFRFDENKVFVGTDGRYFYLDLLENEIHVVSNPHLVGSFAILKDDSMYVHLKRRYINFFDREVAEDPFFRPIAETDFNFSNTKCGAINSSHIYVGTDAGMFTVDKKTLEVDYIDNFPGKFIYSVKSIKITDDKDIWFSTSDRIVRHIAGTEYIRVFDHFDGVPDMDFRDGVGLKTSTGLILKGGSNGIVVFNPDEITTVGKTPALEISNLVLDRTNGVLEGSNRFVMPDLNETLHLKHNQNFFTVNWSMPDFIQPHLVLYTWKLEGFDKQWSEAYRQYSTTYMNLPPGKYTFKIKARDSEFNWSETQSLDILVAKPFWVTWYAYGIYSVLIGLLLYRYRVYTLNRERLHNELKMQRLRLKTIRKMVKKEHEVNEWKFRFFTNVSHEFKTPLMLITSPVEQAIEHGTNLSKSNLQQIYDNSKKLHRMIIQMLDFRKMETGKLHLQKTNDNIIPFIIKTCNYFREPILKKKLDYSVYSSEPALMTSFDPDKIEKILYNLISNALKNTDKGSISIRIDRVFKNMNGQDGDFIQITVADTGKGIPPESIDRVFERYYQVESPNRQDEGTGIGLCLTRELIKLHQGEIKVESMVGEGTTFMVIIPVLQTTDIVDNKQSNDGTPFKKAVVKYSKSFFSTEKINKPIDA